MLSSPTVRKAGRGKNIILVILVDLDKELSSR